MPQLLALLGVVVLGFAALAILFVVGWRAKSGLVLGPIIWFSKRFMNPRQMRSAGTPGAYASDRPAPRARLRDRVRDAGRRDRGRGRVPRRAAVRLARAVAAQRPGGRVRDARPRGDHVPRGPAGADHDGDGGGPVLCLGPVRFRWLRVDDCLRLRNAEPARPPAGRPEERAGAHLGTGRTTARSAPLRRAFVDGGGGGRTSPAALVIGRRSACREAYRRRPPPSATRHGRVSGSDCGWSILLQARDDEPTRCASRVDGLLGERTHPHTGRRCDAPRWRIQMPFPRRRPGLSTQ